MIFSSSFIYSYYSPPSPLQLLKLRAVYFPLSHFPAPPSPSFVNRSCVLLQLSWLITVHFGYSKKSAYIMGLKRSILLINAAFFAIGIFGVNAAVPDTLLVSSSSLCLPRVFFFFPPFPNNLGSDLSRVPST